MVEPLEDYQKRMKAKRASLTQLMQLAHRQESELEILRELFSEMAIKFDFIRNYRKKQNELASSFNTTRTYGEADIEAIEKIAGEYYSELEEMASNMKK